MVRFKPSQNLCPHEIKESSCPFANLSAAVGSGSSLVQASNGIIP